MRCRMQAWRGREHRDIAALNAPCGRGAFKYFDERSVVSVDNEPSAFSSRAAW